MTRQFILVAGVDYEFKHAKGVDFRVFCRSRVARVVAANKAKDDLVITIFDIGRGEVVTHTVTYPTGKRREAITTLSPSPFTAVTRANYTPVVVGGVTKYRFNDGQRNLISIVDVYRAVQKIGVDAPGSLAELSIFSHGWMGGPILVNSFDDGTVALTFGAGPPIPFALPASARDPDDFDPRAKDFIAPTMDAVALANFRAAFLADGHVWIWGCAFPRVVHEILTRMESHSAYRSSGVGGDVVFRFRNLTDEHARYLESCVADVTGVFPNYRQVDIRFKHLKLFACRVSQSGYAQIMATGTGIPVYAAPMGTYAEYEKGHQPLMYVRKEFARHFTFYRNYLGFAFDPEGRKYGKFVPGFSCPIPP